MPVTISVRDFAMCPTTAISNPAASAAVNAPKWEDCTANTRTGTDEPYP